MQRDIQVESLQASIPGAIPHQNITAHLPLKQKARPEGPRQNFSSIFPE